LVLGLGAEHEFGVGLGLGLELGLGDNKMYYIILAVEPIAFGVLMYGIYYNLCIKRKF